MDRHLYQYRPAFRPSSEGRVIFAFDTPGEGKGEATLETEPLMRDRDPNWNNAEYMRRNQQFREKVRPGLETLAQHPNFAKKYAYLTDPQHGHQHMSLVLSLIYTEASKEKDDRTGIGMSEALGNRTLTSFSGVSEKAFKDELGTTLDSAKHQVQNLALTERTAQLYVEWQKDKPGLDDLDQYKEAAFEAWLETWLTDHAKQVNPKTPNVLTTFRVAQSADTDIAQFAGLELTLQRYSAVVDGVIVALGGKPNGEFAFWKLPEEDRIRLVRDVWYGTSRGLEMKEEFGAFGGPNVRGERAASLLNALRYSITRQKDLIVEPHPDLWENPEEHQKACQFLILHLEPERCKKSGISDIYDLLKKVSDGKPTADEKEYLLLQQTLRFLGGAIHSDNTLGMIFSGGGSMRGKSDAKPGNLGELHDVHDVLVTVGSSVEYIRKALPTFGRLQMAQLGTLYLAAKFPLGQSAENWRNREGYEAAYHFFLGLPEVLRDAIVGPKGKQTEFFRELESIVKTGSGNREMVFNVLDAFAEELLSKQIIARESQEERNDRSAIATIGAVMKDGKKEFMKLLKKNPVVGALVGAVFIKAALGLVFSKEKWAGLIRLLIGGGAVALFVGEKYNPWGVKDKVNSMIYGNRWEGTMEDFYAKALKDKEGKLVVDERDDVKHRALVYLGRAPSGEVLDFYREASDARKGISDVEADNLPSRLKIPHFVRQLQDDSTNKISDYQAVKMYMQLLDGFFAHYSTKYGGPENGVGPRRVTSGWESRTADGYEKVRRQVVEGELSVLYIEKQRDLAERAYIQYVRNREFYSRDPKLTLEQRILLAVDDVEKKSDRVDPALYTLTGSALQTLAEQEILRCTPDLLDHMRKRLVGLKELEGFCKMPDTGRNVKFGVIMRTLIDESSLQKYQMAKKGIDRYLYDTGRANVGTRAVLSILDGAEWVGDRASNAYDGAKKKVGKAIDGIPEVLDTSLGVAEDVLTPVNTIFSEATTTPLHVAKDAIKNAARTARNWMRPRPGLEPAPSAPLTPKPGINPAPSAPLTPKPGINPAPSAPLTPKPGINPAPSAPLTPKPGINPAAS